MDSHGAVGLRVPYKIYPLTTTDPAFPTQKSVWVPTLAVSLIINHATTKRMEALVDSGSDKCLFHSDIGRSHGLKIEQGKLGPIGGIVRGAQCKVYYHPVKLVIPGGIVSITAGFSDDLSVAAILGRHGFFENFTITFDPCSKPPGLVLERFYRV